MRHKARKGVLGAFKRCMLGLRQDCLALAAIFVTTDSVAVLQVPAHFTCFGSCLHCMLLSGDLSARLRMKARQYSALLRVAGAGARQGARTLQPGVCGGYHQRRDHRGCTADSAGSRKRQ